MLQSRFRSGSFQSELENRLVSGRDPRTLPLLPRQLQRFELSREPLDDIHDELLSRCEYGVLVESVPVVVRVRFVLRTCVPGMEAEAQPKPEWKEHTFARTPPGSDTPANCEVALRCTDDATMHPASRPTSTTRTLRSPGTRPGPSNENSPRNRSPTVIPARCTAVPPTTAPATHAMPSR